MFRFTIKKATTLALLVLATSLAVAAPANAGDYPSYSMYSPFCSPWTGQQIPQFGILAADRYTYRGETQRVWVRAQSYDWTRQAWSAPSHWFYGIATDFAGPQNWTDATTGQISGNANWSPIIFNVWASGTFQFALQFAWDQGSTGGPSGSTNFLWEPGTCKF